MIQHLRTNQQERISASGSVATEKRLEDYLVRGLIDFDDISYDDHADLLYDLAGEVARLLQSRIRRFHRFAQIFFSLMPFAPWPFEKRACCPSRHTLLICVICG